MFMNPSSTKAITLFALLTIVVYSCRKGNDHGRAKADVIYLETNDYHDGQNAVLAYRNASDGMLTPLNGSPFATHGAGVANPKQVLGPDDSDTQLQLSEDGQFLLAVNSGSNTIAVFRIQRDGSLVPVAGSPFPSGGQTPVSLDVKGRYVFVVNKSDDPLHPATARPNYVTFTIDNDGKLTQVPADIFETAPGSSPAQALVSKNGKFLFGADFLGFMLTPPRGTLRSFTIDGGGKLSPVGGTPYTIPGMGGALGLWEHPRADVLYAGFPLQAKVGVYKVDQSSGALSYQSNLPAGPAACWIRTTRSGHYLYVLNSGENTISMYDASNAQSPAVMGKITLKRSGPIYMAMGMPFTTSEDFSLAFSPDEKYLYVISQHTNPDLTVGNYNYFHVLLVGVDGNLSEPVEPMQLPVDASVRPQGLAVVRAEFIPTAGGH
jgi:6-phosphogluconolactonase (cycloisomerase 2 family)